MQPHLDMARCMSIAGEVAGCVRRQSSRGTALSLLGDLAAPAMPVATADNDPFALFGGLPPAPSHSAGDTLLATSTADVNDGFLAAFAAPALHHRGAAPDFGNVHKSARSRAACIRSRQPSSVLHESQAPECVPAAATASATFDHQRPGSATASQERVLLPEEVADGMLPCATAAVHGSAEQPSPRQPQPGNTPPHPPKLLGVSVTGGDVRQPQRAALPVSGIFQADTYHQPHVASDLGQKAAKALHSGTKWLMKASRSLVTQVQHRLDQHAESAGAAGEACRAARLC